MTVKWTILLITVQLTIVISEYLRPQYWEENHQREDEYEAPPIPRKYEEYYHKKQRQFKLAKKYRSEKIYDEKRHNDHYDHPQRHTNDFYDKKDGPIYKGYYKPRDEDYDRRTTYIKIKNKYPRRNYHHDGMKVLHKRHYYKRHRPGGDEIDKERYGDMMEPTYKYYPYYEHWRHRDKPKQKYKNYYRKEHGGYFYKSEKVRPYMEDNYVLYHKGNGDRQLKGYEAAYARYKYQQAAQHH